MAANNCGFCFSKLTDDEVTREQKERGIAYFCSGCGRPHDKNGRLITTPSPQKSTDRTRVVHSRGHVLVFGKRPRQDYY